VARLERAARSGQRRSNASSTTGVVSLQGRAVRRRADCARLDAQATARGAEARVTAHDGESTRRKLTARATNSLLQRRHARARRYGRGMRVGGRVHFAARRRPTGRPHTSVPARTGDVPDRRLDQGICAARTRDRVGRPRSRVHAAPPHPRAQVRGGAPDAAHAAVGGAARGRSAARLRKERPRRRGRHTDAAGARSRGTRAPPERRERSSWAGCGGAAHAADPTHGGERGYPDGRASVTCAGAHDP